MWARRKSWIVGTIVAVVGACSVWASICCLRSSEFQALSSDNSGSSSGFDNPIHGTSDSSVSSLDATLEAVPSGNEPQDLIGTSTNTAPVEVLLRVDPVGALRVARELPDSDRRHELLEQAVMEWGSVDSSAPVDWVRQIQPGSLRSRLMGAVALGMATGQPLAAAKLAAEEMESGAEQNRIVVGVLQRWIQSDPNGAASWVEQFPETALQRALVVTLLTGWFAKDQTGAEEWVVRLPEGGLRTHARSITSRWSAAPRPL